MPKKTAKKSGKTKKVALVTGANRGIGYEVARQLAKKGYVVIVAGRDDARVESAVKKLKKEKLEVVGLTLDVTDLATVAFAEKFVARNYGRLDVLVNNAAVMLDTARVKAFETADEQQIRTTFETNFYGPFRLMQAFLPVMKEQGYGRIVNVSSEMGQLTESRPDYIAYRTSKTALNQLTRIVSLDAGDYDIKCNSVCPGWVRTDMGGWDAERSPAKGAETIVWLATLKKDGPTGGFFKDKKSLNW